VVGFWLCPSGDVRRYVLAPPQRARERPGWSLLDCQCCEMAPKGPALPAARPASCVLLEEAGALGRRVPAAALFRAL
jgi:hypothetical protein